MKHLMFRRRQEGKTDYRKRLALLKSGRPRVVVRRSNRNIQVQFTEYAPTGDKVVTGASGTELKKYGWEHALSNTSSAYLTGLLAGKKALKNNVREGILDIGLYTPKRGARIFAALKGVADAGIDIPFGEDIVPGADRLHGGHISEDIAGKVDEIKTRIEADYE
jgi:large subunit ribosomal protein L18